jgi:hypothetical protein
VCSRHPEDGAGFDYQEPVASRTQPIEAVLAKPKKPAWLERVVFGGWDSQQAQEASKGTGSR